MRLKYRPVNTLIARQAGVALSECLITLLLFSLATVNASTMLLDSLRLMAHNNNQLIAARLVADASTLHKVSPDTLPSLSERAAKVLPDGKLLLTHKQNDVLIEASWQEPDSAGRLSRVARLYAE